MDFEFVLNVDCIVLMGGFYKEGGNIMFYVEVNIYYDFYVVEVVFVFGVKVEMVGLDVIY